MKHLHEASGLMFEIGELVEPDRKKTYDITVITFWPDAESGAASPMNIVNWYFGDYDKNVTDSYIDEWLRRQPWSFVDNGVQLL